MATRSGFAEGQCAGVPTNQTATRVFHGASWIEFMKRYTLVGLSCAILSAFSGCIPWGDYYTVPWWKGVPASVIAPSSLEAMAWQQQKQERHQQYHGETLIHVADTSGDDARPAR